ncbi:MAG TPA: sigma-70 family RNA polymerase sigma factor [Thermoanaerobaculia bacterium]|nr:sigma-70 family RNA polymerase sigma factor [Thermoanaerobaculia bacterium]
MNGAIDPEIDPETEESLDDLVRRIRHRLKTVLRHYDIPFQDAEDLLQDSLLEALRKWDTIYNRECWLIGTLRFKCSNYWKRIRYRAQQSMDLPELEGVCQPLPPPQEKRDEALDLRRKLRRLDPRHRKALWLRFAMGFTPQEVGELLGYSHTSVRKLTQRAMTRLRKDASRSGPLPGLPPDDLDDPEDGDGVEDLEVADVPEDVEEPADLETPDSFLSPETVLDLD